VKFSTDVSRLMKQYVMIIIIIIMKHAYSSYICTTVHPKSFTIMSRISPQPSPQCNVNYIIIYLMQCDQLRHMITNDVRKKQHVYVQMCEKFP